MLANSLSDTCAFGAILRRRVVPVLALGAFLGCLGAVSPAEAADDPYDGHWHFALTPYLWVPFTDARLRFDTPQGSPDVTIKPSTILSDLDFGFMGAGDARKGNWTANFDLIYFKLSSENTSVRSVTGPLGIVEIPIDTGSQTGLEGVIWTFAPGYTVVRSPAGSLDLLVGFRYARFNSSLDWQLSGPLAIFPKIGSFSDTIALWDALIGVKGRVSLTPDGKWFLPYYLDIGTGESTVTSQGVVGVGYAFGWGDVHLDYRVLYYDTPKSHLLDHLTQHGPALAVTFHL